MKQYMIKIFFLTVGLLLLVGNAAGLTEEAKLIAALDGTEGDNLGYSVSVDGDTAIIGAPYHDAGSAYVFIRSGGTWIQQEKLTASDGAEGDQFGVSVAVDGDTAVIGAHYNDNYRGSVYVFTRSGDTWTQQVKLNANDGEEGDEFGVLVAVDGDTALIGASTLIGISNDDIGIFSRSAYVFTRNGGTWTQQDKLVVGGSVEGYELKCSVALDGDTAVIGVPYHDDDDKGSAYVFTRSNGIWTQQDKLIANDGVSGDWFGWSVSVDGDTTVIGAGGASGSYDYDVGNAAYVFTRNGGTWMQQDKLIANDSESWWAGFGKSVAVDGDTAVICREDGGFVFVRSGDTWMQQDKLIASDDAIFGYFGYSVSMDGDMVVIGTPGKGINSGSAYVYSLGSTGGNVLMAFDDSYVIHEDSALNIIAPGVLGNDNNPEGDTLNAVLVNSTTNGTLNLNGNGSFSYTPNQDFNGLDSFTYKANNGTADSNTATVSITINAVNDGPVADSNGPYTGTEGTDITFDVTGSYDPDGNIISYNWDFGDGSSGTGVTPTHAYEQDGIYTVTLTVTDNDGAIDSDSTTAVVGNIAPTVIILSPPAITNDSAPLLHATFDQIAAYVWYTIDGAAGTGGSNTDNLTVILPEREDGQHTVTVYANNTDGNVGNATKVFLVDTIVPVIMIDQVTSPTNDNSQTINGTFNESDSGIDSITVNGVSATISGVNYSAIIDLTEGTNTVDVIAVDKAGNSGSNSTTIVLDTIAPTVTIDQVISPTNDNSQTINGTFNESDSGIDTITVNGVSATISGANYSAIIDLTEGINPVEVIAVDTAGNIGSNSTTIVLDTIAPTANITAPQNNTEIKYFENIIKGNVFDEHFDSAVLKVNSGSDVSTYDLTITDNSFAQRVEFTPYQNNTLELVVFDTAGNSNNDTVLVFIRNNTLQEECDVSNNESTIIDAMDETDTMIEFHSNVTESNVTFTVTAITDQELVDEVNSSASVFGEAAMGKIVEINVTGLDATNESQVKYARIELCYTIDDLDLDGDGTVEFGELNEDNLFIYWCNETSGNWTKLLKDNPEWVLDNGQVKISESNPVGYVWVDVKHLSMFGLAAGSVPESTYDGDGNDGYVPPSSGGGGGGGSGSSGEAYGNIAVKEVIRNYVSVETRNTYQFEGDANAIGFVTFDAKTNAGYIAATVEVLKDTSSLVSSAPSGKVYQNMNIWVGTGGYATENNIANPIIGFKVAKSWINENDIDESTIELNRYSSGVWDQLPTTKTDEDGSYIYFNSETPGFSSFAITGDERSSTAAVDTDGPLFSPPSSTTDDDLDEPIGETVSVPYDEAKSSSGLVLVIGLIVISVIVVGVYLRKNKN